MRPCRSFTRNVFPEVLIQNENLSDEFYEILEAENLDDKARERLETEFAQEMEVIKRDDRLETIAKISCTIFPVEAISVRAWLFRSTSTRAVKMYDKVQKYWKEEMQRLVGQSPARQTTQIKQRCKRFWTTCVPSKWPSSSAKMPEKKSVLQTRVGHQNSP